MIKILKIFSKHPNCSSKESCESIQYMNHKGLKTSILRVINNILIIRNIDSNWIILPFGGLSQ